MPFPSLSSRRLRPEVMDQVELDPAEHRRALRGLGRLNLASGVAACYWREINKRLRPARGDALRLLDVASGGGDVPLGLWRCAHRQGVTLRVLGLDKSATAVQHAAAQVESFNGQMTFMQQDVLKRRLPSGFDIVTCSLFLHHLPASEVIALLRNMSAAAPLLLVSDLCRTLRGLALAHAACRLLTASPVVRSDGPQSVANAFSIAEMRDLCDEAGLQIATITRTWPCRMLIVRHRSSQP
jgi:2-polyprenyl-3-methyl-5-hydroxy-6-metoxy-1,4-benzoquinol methylase